MFFRGQVNKFLLLSFIITSLHTFLNPIFPWAQDKTDFNDLV